MRGQRGAAGIVLEQDPEVVERMRQVRGQTLAQALALLRIARWPRGARG